MKNAVFNFPLPANEPVKSYLKGSPERVALEAELKRQSGIQLDIKTERYPARHTVDYRRQGDPHRQHRKGGHAS